MSMYVFVYACASHAAKHACCGLCCPLQDPLDTTRSVIVIRSLVAGGVAESYGGLLPGDQLVFVNNTHLDSCTLAQAVEVLKAAPAGKVYLGIKKPLGVRKKVLLSYCLSVCQWCT